MNRIAWIWGVFIFVLVLILAYEQRNELVHALPYLQKANYSLLLLSSLLEVLYYVLQALATQWLYTTYNKKPRLVILTLALLQAAMLNEVFPTSGASGTVGFIYWAKRLGYGLQDTIKVNIWLSLLSYVALVPMIALSITAMFSLPLNAQHMIGGALEVFAIVSIVLVFIFAFSFWQRKRKQRRTIIVMHSDNHFWGKWLSRLWKKIDTIQHTVHTWFNEEIGHESQRLRKQLRKFILTTMLLASIYLVRMAMLEISFLALHTQIPLSTIAYAYALTLLFSLVSFSPTTLGVVEVALVTCLGWFNTTPSMSIAAMILYRLVSYWLPIPLGILSQWWLRRLPVQDSEIG